MKSTKILATIGPKTQAIDVMRQLVLAGMNGVRLNFSHGNHEFHKQTIDNARLLEQELGIHIPTILDTKGPEIRTGTLVNGEPIILEAGNEILVSTDIDTPGDSYHIRINYPTLIEDVSVGGRIMISDGLVALQILEKVDAKTLRCKLLNSAKLGERKNVNLPNVIVNLPALAEKDKADLAFGCEQQVDYIAASFIRKAADMHEVRGFLDSHGGKYIKIIAKIENQEGLDNIDDIIELADGIMVARGDLGMDIAMSDLPLAQKMMIHKCNQAGKLVITATQMLDSMIQNPLPTRAEVTDIANAILDGTDAVMLSGETAAGSYPLEAVTMMAAVCKSVDPTVLENHNRFHITGPTKRMQELASELTCAIAQGAVTTAHAIHATAIVIASNAGTTVRQVRKQNPLCPLIVITPYEMTARQLMMLRGVSSYYIKEVIKNYEQFFSITTKILLENSHANVGENIVITGGGSVGGLGQTDMIKVAAL